MRRALFAPIAVVLPVSAAAAPSFKPAPGSDTGAGTQGEDGGAWSDLVPVDLAAAPPWLQGVLEFLAGNYGYLGAAAVVLMLFLFARGSGGGETAEAARAGGDEDFFEPGDADRYGGRR